MTAIIRKALLFFLCFLVIEGIAHSEKNQFVFDRNEHDLGMLEEGSLLSFDIPLKNITGQRLNIISLEPSCGCIEAVIIDESIGSIGSGKTGIIRVTIDTTGKIGKIVQIIEIMTDASPEPFILKLRALVRHPGDGVIDAGAIFREGCRRCHVGENIESKQGEELFNAVCFMCHKDYAPPENLSKGLLKKSISDGVVNTSMPGFFKINGGPLSHEQISSLADLLEKRR